MRDLESMLAGRITLAMSTKLEVEQAIASAGLVIGAVLIPGARAPKLITREMLGHDNADPLAAQWLIRVFLALWCWPLKDPAAERALVQRFLGSP